MVNISNITVQELPQNIQQAINESINGYELVFSRIDNFDEQVVDQTIDEVEHLIADLPKKLRKRIFKITVELVQNIYRHSHQPPKDFIVNYDKFGFFILTKISNFAYKITMGNFVDLDKKEYLETYLTSIKTLSESELKEFYYQILDNKNFTTKGGGGLGFLEIAKKSNSNFDFKFINYNLGMYLFVYNVILSIENQ